MNKEKTRGQNYSKEEREMLLLMCNKYKNIIENKKTDAINWKAKEKIWNKIENEFNSSTVGPFRSAKQLKEKYNCVKKELRNEKSKEKKYLLGTGGGGERKSLDKSEAEKELLETISLSVEGLSNDFDCDGVAGFSGTNPTAIAGPSKEEIDIIDIDHFVLLQPSDPIPDPVPDTQPTPTSPKPTEPNVPRKRKRPELNSNGVRAEYSNLAKEKLDLIKFQKTIMIEEEVRKNELHELKVKKNKLKIEKLELEMKMLNEQQLV